MKERKRKKVSIGGLAGVVVTTFVATLAVMASLNWNWVCDWYAGINYEPSAEMANIRNKLKLTDRGEFLFNASQPELNDSEDFNENCEANNVEIATLGCFTNEKIFVYNIEEPELKGIVESTTAHELLHAVFERMSEKEKETLRPSLEKTLATGGIALKEEIETYPEKEQFEELYVRAGTEVRNLPDDLKKHYGEIFAERNEVVKFYEDYISVFRTITKELETLSAEIEETKETVEKDLAQYEREAKQLEADIVSFNACAEVEGCFKSRTEFNRRRNSLITNQSKLEKDYEKINEKINEYNKKVEEYNKQVLHGNNLNKIINSNSRPAEI